MKQKTYEAKYNVDLVQDESGQTKFVQREKDELQLEQEKLKAKKLEKKGIIVKSKEDKRKEKRLKEKEKRMKKKRRAFSKQINEDFDNTPEEVAFNEIVHAPPKLVGVKNNEARRPGTQKNLILLNSADKILNEKSSSSQKKFVKPTNFNNKETKTKKKMKQKISLCKQQMLETDRMSIVEQYRAIKQKNIKHQ